MTRDDVLRMAKEADLWMTSEERIVAVERFAALVRADEREACATVCDEMYLSNLAPDLIDVRRTAAACADTIRARGETK
jgi:hypothetical protein